MATMRNPVSTWSQRVRFLNYGAPCRYLPALTPPPPLPAAPCFRVALPQLDLRAGLLQRSARLFPGWRAVGAF